MQDVVHQQYVWDRNSRSSKLEAQDVVAADKTLVIVPVIIEMIKIYFVLVS